jgi:hypothetical protein
MDSDCRSGLCAGMACADTCCSTAGSGAECASGASCRFGTFPGRGFDVHYASYCSATMATGANAGSCNSNAACKSNLCAIGCHDACRSSADCGSPSQECAYQIPNLAGVVTACATAMGSAAEGAACTGNADCHSGFCDTAASMLCTDVCYADSDCTMAGWRCRPQQITLPGGASYSVLECGM